MKVRAVVLPICLVSIAFGAVGAQAQEARRPGATPPITSIEDKVTGLKKIDGYFPLYWDDAAARLWLEIPKLDTEVLYSTGLATGLGRTTSASIAARSPVPASSSSSVRDRRS